MSYNDYLVEYHRALWGTLPLFVLAAAVILFVYKTCGWRTAKWFLVASIALPILILLTRVDAPYNEANNGFEAAFGLYFCSILVAWAAYSIYRSRHIDEYNRYIENKFAECLPPSDAELLHIKQTKTNYPDYQQDRIYTDFERTHLIDLWEKETRRKIASDDPFAWIKARKSNRESK